MRLARTQVDGADVDDVAADRLRRVERQREVLVHLEDAQLCAGRRPVDRPLVDGVRLRLVDQLAANTKHRTGAGVTRDGGRVSGFIGERGRYDVMITFWGGRHEKRT